MRKTIYFHIGTHKTGSTAIQEMLVMNKNILKQYGIKYDFLENGINHIELSHNIDKWKNITLDKSYDYIFSSEDFYDYFFSNGEEANIFKVLKLDKIKEFNVKIIVYFRQQDKFIESLNNEIVKRHGYYKNYKLDIVNLDYYNFLCKLNNYVDKKNIYIRVYDKKEFFKGSIYLDFLHLLQIDRIDEFVLSQKNINPSFTRNKLEFMRLINMLKLPIQVRTNIYLHLLQVELDKDMNENIIPFDIREKIIKKYAVGNTAIAKEFLGREDGKLFYEEIIEDENWEPYPGLNERVAKEIFEKIKKIDNNILKELLNLILTKKDVTVDFTNGANFLTPILLDVLEKNNKFTPFSTKNEASTFSTIREKLDEKSDSADILREVALAFEESNDIETAYKIMEKAKMLRPNGPFINQKLQEYIQILDESF